MTEKHSNEKEQMVKKKKGTNGFSSFRNQRGFPYKTRIIVNDYMKKKFIWIKVNMCDIHLILFSCLQTSDVSSIGAPLGG